MSIVELVEPAPRRRKAPEREGRRRRRARRPRPRRRRRAEEGREGREAAPKKKAGHARRRPRRRARARRSPPRSRRTSARARAARGCSRRSSRPRSASRSGRARRSPTRSAAAARRPRSRCRALDGPASVSLAVAARPGGAAELLGHLVRAVRATRCPRCSGSTQKLGGPRASSSLAVSVDEARRGGRRVPRRASASRSRSCCDPEKRVVERATRPIASPRRCLIDRDGIVVERYIGPRDWDAPPTRRGSRS